VTKKLSADERGARKMAAAALYIKQIGRKAQKGVEPNDRKFDRDFDRKAKRMPPIEFDALLRDEDN
jgi:hypothetical protein